MRGEEKNTDQALWTVVGLSTTVKLAITNKLSAAESFNRYVTLYTKIFLLSLMHTGCPLVIETNSRIYILLFPHYFFPEHRIHIFTTLFLCPGTMFHYHVIIKIGLVQVLIKDCYIIPSFQFGFAFSHFTTML